MFGVTYIMFKNVQFSGNWFQVHKIAETTSVALAKLVLSTTGFSEIWNGAELSINWSSIEPSVIDFVAYFYGVVFVFHFYVYVANEMIAQIVANIHLFDFTIKSWFFKIEVIIKFAHGTEQYRTGLKKNSVFGLNTGPDTG